MLLKFIYNPFGASGWHVTFYRLEWLLVTIKSSNIFSMLFVSKHVLSMYNIMQQLKQQLYSKYIHK